MLDKLGTLDVCLHHQTKLCEPAVSNRVFRRTLKMILFTRY